MMYTDLKEELITTWFLMDAEKMNQVQHFLQAESKVMTVQTPIRAIFRCQDLRSALRLLEKWNLLCPQRVEVLGTLAELTDCHPVMVREKLEQYKKLCCPPTLQDDFEPWQQQQPYHQSNHYAHIEDPSLYLPPREIPTTHTNNFSTPQDNVQPDSIYLEIIEYLSMNMRDQWKDVGRKLGLHNRVSELMHSPGRQKDKVIQMFTEHYEDKRGENALSSILDALKECRLNRQRDHILNHILAK